MINTYIEGLLHTSMFNTSTQQGALRARSATRLWRTLRHLCSAPPLP
jgi:hypothetical protein